MANRRFIDFPIASTVGDSDIILIWQGGANKQTTKATFLSGLPENLDELNDVAISGLTNGQILRYDSVTGKWENTDQGNLDLNDLNDVSIVSPSNGQVLVYNSSTSKWENSSGGYVPYTGAVTTVNLGAQTIQAGQFVKAGGTAAQFLKADGSVDSTAYGTGSVTSVALTMPSAFNVANSPITTAGTLAVTGAGTVGQYIRGDGSLADFPQASGGGSSVSYYLNGSISQGTIGGVSYKELNKVPILGAGTDFTINADGYIASFLTDAGDPNLLEIPGGNWNFETYFSASSSGGSPSFYVELYKYDGTTFTLIASSSSSPELIAFGTNLNPYFSTLAVPTTTLALTDRLSVRYYVTHSGRTITLHTENNHLCQVVTTFTTGLTSLNGLTAQVQNLAVGTSGTDFNIASATATHTFNLPTASATNRGALSSADWTTFNSKQNALTNPVTGTGTTNYLPKFTGSTTIGNSQVFDNGTNVGIGTASPQTVSSGFTLTVGDGATQQQPYLALSRNSLGGFWAGIRWYDGNTIKSVIQEDSDFNLRFSTSNVERLRITSGGNLLVGTTSDNGARLQVSGTASFSGIVTAGGGNGPTLGFQLTTTTGTSTPRITNDNVNATVIRTGASGSPVVINNFANSLELVRFTDSGNVGIGTASPIVLFSLGKIGTPNQLGFYDGATAKGFIGIAASTSDIIATDALNDMVIRPSASGNLLFAIGSTERMRITSGGNVLIGTTTNGSSKLKINGLPTSSAGLASGDVWNDSGTLKIA